LTQIIENIKKLLRKCDNYTKKHLAIVNFL
jgi:hypothetical protein